MSLNDWYKLFSEGVFVYSAFVMCSYLFIALLSIAETRRYFRKTSFTDYNVLASSNHAPSLTIIAPAYNEEATIVENVRSLLNIYYPNYEVIIVNDGSKDGSLQKLVREYSLQPMAGDFSGDIATKAVRAVYKSTNPVYGRLLVVDKENGGKADALNVGINLSTKEYIVCIDVDCVLEQDAMLKLVKPFLEHPEVRTIATGGVVRIANSCEVKDGKLITVHLPKQWLPRLQVLEYIRAFLLGRMAWSRLNGLLLISGAFGAFDREIVKKVGGYSTKTVGEDMELVVRMRRYMEERKIPYRVAYIPDPLCWTEAPANYKILGRQRNRWTRGTIETLRMHKGMFFNKRYGLLGLLSYPYWFFFECLAPVIEFLGLFALVAFIVAGKVDWTYFLSIALFVYAFCFLFSVFAIFMEVMTYNQYKRKKDVLRLVAAAVAEPVCYHPFLVWSAVRGFVDYFRKKKSWGEMKREGFKPALT